MSDSKETLIRKRASLKARLTCFTNYIGNLKNKIKDEGSALNEIEIAQLQERLERVKGLLVDFDDIQNSLEAIVEPTEAEEQYRERDIFESNHSLQIAIAKTIVVKYCKTDRAKVTEEIIVNNGNALVNTMHNVGVKLPTIEIPKFDGNYNGWLAFRDTYQSLIHENDKISDIQKYHYLKAALSGTASSVISSLEFSSANYLNAYETLRERFDNNRLLIFNHVKALFEIEQLSRSSADELQNIMDTVKTHLRALEQLDQPVKMWDTLIIYLIVSKLDSSSAHEWEKYRMNHTVPVLKDLFTFIKGRADLLQTVKTNTRVKQTAKVFVAETADCKMCHRNHTIGNCEEFLKLSIEDRFDLVKKLRLCLNCLNPGHFVMKCRGGRCKICKRKHHVTLHRNLLANKVIPSPNSASVETDESVSVGDRQGTSAATLSACVKPTETLLATAIVDLIDSNGKDFRARALLDSGSQCSFITTELCNKMHLRKSKVELTVSGLNQATCKSLCKCDVRLHSRYGCDDTLQCFVLPKVTGNVPSFTFDINSLQIPTNLTLADPDFNKSRSVDMLIGVDLFWNIVKGSQIKLGFQKPILLDTIFGWVLSGPINRSSSMFAHCNVVSTQQLNDQLSRSWLIEDYEQKTFLSDEEQACEMYFTETTKRNSDGCFIVKMPFKESLEKLGDSREMAQKRFATLERKLNLNPRLKQLYNDNLNDYLKLGHMIPVKNGVGDAPCYYMPHHSVLRESRQLLLANIRERFWPIGGRNLAKKTVRNCIRCFKTNPKSSVPLMGNLPQDRFQADFPFLVTGVDYAGPLLIRDRKGRGSKHVKCYIAVFVCFGTKAIHLELVSELTTEAFLLALRRFISRRGKPRKIISDNGKNFVGANIELEHILKDKKLVESLTGTGIVWSFTPPYAPNFGGLWEGAVKSVKGHLKRVTGNAFLNFEEMQTLLAQIESVLNSRPLTQLSTDPNDNNPLTPAHFLLARAQEDTVEESVLLLPSQDCQDISCW